jgi:type I restriction enzyme S subunit
LLQRILAERRKNWEESNRKSKIQNRKYREPAAPDLSAVASAKAGTANLPPLPEGWTWASVEQLGEVQLGRQRSPKNVSKNFPTKYIRAANITERGLDLSDVLEMEF